MKQLINKSIIFCCFALSCLAQDRIKIQKNLLSEEGYKPFIYTDSFGYRTYGIGHKAEKYTTYIHISYEDALTILYMDIENSIRSARRLVKNYNTQPLEVQNLLVCLHFQLGSRGLADFRKMISAIQKREYHKAAFELRNSLYYRQLPKRVEKYAQILEKA